MSAAGNQVPGLRSGVVQACKLKFEGNSTGNIIVAVHQAPGRFKSWAHFKKLVFRMIWIEDVSNHEKCLLLIATLWCIDVSKSPWNCECRQQNHWRQDRCGCVLSDMTTFREFGTSESTPWWYVKMSFLSMFAFGCQQCLMIYGVCIFTCFMMLHAHVLLHTSVIKHACINQDHSYTR